MFGMLLCIMRRLILKAFFSDNYIQSVHGLYFMECHQGVGGTMTVYIQKGIHLLILLNLN